MADFHLNEALDRLAARLCRDIRSERRRHAVMAEYRSHLEDGAEDFMRQGYTPEAAYAEVEASLGDTDKISTLLASVHNARHFPKWIPCLLGVGVLGWLIYLYVTTENYNLRSWIEIILQSLAISAIVAVTLIASVWIRAFRKRTSVLKRLKKYVKENGGKLTKNGNCYRSLFVRTAIPELLVDMGERRYIISMWATVKRRRTLHLQDNGIYSYDKHFGYMLASPGIAPNSRITFFRPKGMENDPLFTFYHSEMGKLPEGAHLIPEINYREYFTPNKVNIPIFLLNPIPLDVEICENGHIHRLVEGDTLPVSLGSARLYSMSSLISLMEEMRIFGREGGKKENQI